MTAVLSFKYILFSYEKAAFCLEELLLSNPHHHLYHQRYAEVCYTQKTVESLEVARKHFALAAKLNPDNMRALYGFFMVCLLLHAICLISNSSLFRPLTHLVTILKLRAEMLGLRTVATVNGHVLRYGTSTCNLTQRNCKWWNGCWKRHSDIIIILEFDLTIIIIEMCSQL